MQAKKAANATRASPITSQWRCSSTGSDGSQARVLLRRRRLRDLDMTETTSTAVFVTLQGGAQRDRRSREHRTTTSRRSAARSSIARAPDYHLKEERSAIVDRASTGLRPPTIGLMSS